MKINKMSIFIVLLLSSLNMIAMEADAVQITSFDWKRDAQDVLQIIYEDPSAHLIRRDFNTNKNVKTNVIYPTYPEKDGSAMFTVAETKKRFWVLLVVVCLMLFWVILH